MNRLLALARPEIVNMQAYRSARSEQTQGNFWQGNFWQGNFSQGDFWLDANEAPWDDPYRYNRYPEPQPKNLINLLSNLYGVNTDQVLVTRGSDEGIDLLVRAFCNASQDSILICPPTYGMYQVAATIQNAHVLTVPLIKEQNFSLNLRGILKAWQPTTKLIFLCSPNNPTGNLLSTSDILELCTIFENRALIIVDEAYIEFSDSASLTSYLKIHSNLIILRTLSKAYGLAGLRCGSTLANPALINLLKKVIPPYPIAQPVINLVEQQLSAEALMKTEEKISLIKLEKNKIMSAFKNQPQIKKAWDSQTNFILFSVEDAQQVMKIFIQHGIVLRNRHKDYSLENCIRMTIGTPFENQRCLEVLNAL